MNFHKLNVQKARLCTTTTITEYQYDVIDGSPLYLYGVSKAPIPKNMLESHRTVAQERFVLQGFEINTLAGSSDALRLQASGNAYLVPLMLAVMAPILATVKHDLGKKNHNETSDLQRGSPCVQSL